MPTIAQKSRKLAMNLKPQNSVDEDEAIRLSDQEQYRRCGRGSKWRADEWPSSEEAAP